PIGVRRWRTCCATRRRPCSACPATLRRRAASMTACATSSVGNMKAATTTCSATWPTGGATSPPRPRSTGRRSPRRKRKPKRGFTGTLPLALETLYTADDTDDAFLAGAIAHAQRAKEIAPATADYSVSLQRLEVRQAFIARHGHAAMKLAPDQYRLRFQLDSRL